MGQGKSQGKLGHCPILSSSDTVGIRLVRVAITGNISVL